MKPIDEITCADTKDLPDAVFYDVREQDEWDAGHIPGATLLPLSELSENPQLFTPPQDGRPVVLYCQRGMRSMRAAQLLRVTGVTIPLYNLTGGYAAWSA